jgi:predicted enzyme related to lactoylglutathione lyase
MRVKRIGWAGTRTNAYPAMVAFLQAVLGLTRSQEGSDFAAFQLPEGGTFEVSGPGDRDHAHFSTGPVVGFVVDDLPAAVRELEAAGGQGSYGAPAVTIGCEQLQVNARWGLRAGNTPGVAGVRVSRLHPGRRVAVGCRGIGCGGRQTTGEG